MKNIKTGLAILSTIFLLLNNNMAMAQEKTAIPTQESIKNQPVRLNYIKLDGIPGSVKVKGFEDYNPLAGWSFGATVYDKKATYQDLYLSSNDSVANARIFKALTDMRVIPTVTIVSVDPSDKKVLLRFIMHNVSVTSFQTGDSGGYINDTIDIMSQISMSYESGTFEGGEFDRNQKAASENSVNFTVPKKTVYNQ